MTTILKWLLDWAANRLVNRLSGPEITPGFKWCCDCGSFEVCNGQVTVMKCGCE